MRQYWKDGFLLLGLALGIFLLNKLTGPISFLLLSTIVLSIIFYAATFGRDVGQSGRSVGPLQAQVLKRNLSRTRIVSMLFVFLVFCISVKVLYDYQRPGGSKPYFFNTHHHAIKNTGLAFRDGFTLYSDTAQRKGLWDTDGGQLDLKANGDALELNGTRFFIPVYAKREGGRDVLLNPQFPAGLRTGDFLEEGLNRLSILEIACKKDWKQDLTDRYDISLRFTSSDSTVVPAGQNKVEDIIQLKNISLVRGMELKDLLYAHESGENSASTVNLLRWLFPRDIYLLRNHASGTNPESVQFFIKPTDFDRGTRLQVGGQTYLAQSLPSRVNMPLTKDASFYVGIEHRQRSLRVISTGSLDWLNRSNGGYTHVLNFEQVAFKNISDIEEKGQTLGSYNILYLLNNLDNLSNQGENKLREGLLFHEDLKENGLTNLGESYLKFKNDLPGTPLDVDVWTQDDRLIRDEGSSIQKYFAIQTESKSHAWLFDIWDLDQEGNAFTFDRQVVYLTLLFLAIIALLYFAPSISLLAIETPFWMILYSLVVFRLLLLWRIATFPPLQNINSHELNNTMRGFDISLPVLGPVMPIPFTVLLFLFLIGLVYLSRMPRFQAFIQPRLDRFRFSIPAFSQLKNPVWRHAGVLILLFVASQVLTVEFLNRLLKIVGPTISYFYFYHWSVRNEQDYSYDWLKTTRRQTPIWIDLFQVFVRSNRFFLSFVTLAYFFLVDRGFGVIFLVFLILQGALLSLTTGSVGRTQDRLRMVRILLGYFLVLVFYLLISFKNLIHYLLEYKQLVLILSLILIIVGIQVLVKKQERFKRRAIGFFGLLFLLVVLPWTWDPAEDFIENKIRHVRYRASILNKPLTDVLLQHEYRSGSERKIIETAQNQWFIHSYLNQDPIVKSGINLQPHFKKAVDFSTQTRDVVLPRFVIAEFGSLPMVLLLVLMALPLVMYLLRYKVSSKGRLNPDALVSVIALLLLFTIAIIVWLSATNRFVFFGQDFPLISLTSRVSLFIPMLVFFIVQTRNPYAQGVSDADLSINFRRWLLFFGLTVLVIVVAGRSNKLNSTDFSLDLEKIAGKFETDVNEKFIAEQQKEGPNLRTILSSSNTSTRDAYISKWLTAAAKNQAPQNWNEEFPIYLNSILDFITSNPARGFDTRSPVHFIEQNEVLKLELNQYYQFELPAYSREKVWKGDLVGDITPERVLKSGIESAYLDSTLLGPNNTPLAVIWPDPAQSPYYILRRDPATGKKDLVYFDRSYGPQLIREGDLLFYKQASSGGYATWSISAATRKFFAVNMTINGMQRMVYPLGKSAPWVREWTQFVKRSRERDPSRSLLAPASINLDHGLTQAVGNTLNKSLPIQLRKQPKSSRRVIFSVIGADGDGRIRLLSDYAQGRIILNPNDEAAYAKKLEDEYFERNNEISRLQWGNWNLLHMKDGPGSSIKPMILSAIMSQIKLEWNTLVFQGNPLAEQTPARKDPKLFKVERYAGHTFERPTWETNRVGAGTVNMEQYLSSSNNPYHTLIYFLGSYPVKQLRPYSSFRQFLPRSTSADDYPLIRVDGDGPYTLPSKTGGGVGWPALPSNKEYSHFTDPNSLMGVGLSNNFRLQLGSANSDLSLRGHNEDFTKENIQLKSLPITWSTPERSFFNLLECADTSVTTNIYRGIRNPALGGGVFRLTPYDAINYYARLFNFDQNFNASIDARSGPAREWQTLGSSWSGSGEFVEYLKGTTFKGMETTFSQGTASPYFGISRGLLKGYRVFAKTGTTGSGSDDNSKRLVLVIVKDDPSLPFPKQKKYFLYFTVQNAYTDDSSDKFWFAAIYDTVLTQVLNSSSFKKYMN